jgi:peptidoglycan/LPS O-acetylase OafA/YrhL
VPAVESPRIASLDGLRALSIACVIIGHLLGLPYVGNLGVRIFFVISGYLITRLLLDEERAGGGVSLWKFYVRRALRIFPPFYVYLLVVALCSAFGGTPPSHSDYAHALTYTMNYVPVWRRAWIVGHLWSLGVEEQFYILWPAVLLLTRAVRRATIAVAVIVAALAARVLFHYLVLPPSNLALVLEAFPSVMDTLAIGCLMALTDERRPAWYLRFVSGYGFYLALAVLIAAGFLQGSLYDLYLVTLTNLSIGVVVDRCVRSRDGIAFRVLNQAAVVFIGQISYSLYLWQQPFVVPAIATRWVFPHGVPATARLPLNLILALLFALGSYFLVERPSAKLRRRFKPVAPQSGA